MTGAVRQTWVSDRGIVATVVATMDGNGQAAAGKVTASFARIRLDRPAVLGSSYDKLQADKRFDP